MYWKKTIAGLNWLFMMLIVLSCSKQDKSESKQSNASFADSTVVALVNGDPIHYSDVDKAINQSMNQLEKDAVQFPNLQSDTALWKAALDWIVSARLLAQEAEKLNIKADSIEVAGILNTIKRRFASEQKFFDALAEAEFSFEQYKNNLTKELMIQKLLDQQLGSQIKGITDNDALQFYNEHGEEFMQLEQIRVHHILFKVAETADPEKVKTVENKATRILERIKKGEDFEVLARQYSEDPSSALRGGDIGFFSRGDMIKNFEDAAFALQEKEVSNLVRTPLGFHIIRLDQKKSSQKAPFDDVKIAIKLKLQEKLIQQYVETLKSKANIKIRENLI